LELQLVVAASALLERYGTVVRYIEEDGFDVEAPSRQHRAWAFSFQAPGGFKIVVRC